MAEQRAGFVDTALAHQPADAGAADHEVLVADRIDLLGLEPVARARARAASRSCRRDRARTGSWRPPTLLPTRIQSTSTLRTNVSGSHCDISCVKRTIAAPWTPDPAIASSRWAVVIRSGGALSGLTTRGGCGSKVITVGGGTALVRDAADAVQDLPVAAMHAVEVAERQHRMTPACRARIVRKVNDVHFNRGASPLELPHTLSRAPLRRRAPFAWLARALARDAVGS